MNGSGGKMTLDRLIERVQKWLALEVSKNILHDLLDYTCTTHYSSLQLQITKKQIYTADLKQAGRSSSPFMVSEQAVLTLVMSTLSSKLPLFCCGSEQNAGK